MAAKILYTGAFRYPDLDAAAFRVTGICQLLEANACEVQIAGWEDKRASYEFDGRLCFPQREFNDGKKRNIVKRLLGFIFRGSKTFNWILKNSRFDLYILYNPPAIFAIAMLLWAKMSGNKVALDVTEWYESSHLVGGKYGLASIENWMRMKVVYPMFDDIIVISTFLENYFESRQCQNVVKCFPIANSNSDVENVVRDDSKVTFIYAGQPGKKDLIIEFIHILPTLQNILDKDVFFHLVGPNKEEFSQVYRSAGYEFESIEPHIYFHGFLSREQVFSLYRKSDFSILFREDQRYARAGFPTKGMESLVNGCPIILNDIGDISSVVKDINGGMVTAIGYDVQLIADLIKKQVFNRDEIIQKSQKFFGKAQYIQLIGEFIKGVDGGQYRN